MLLLKLMMLLHDAVHVVLGNLLDCGSQALFERMVGMLQSQLSCHLFLEPPPSFLFVEFGPFCKVNGGVVSLVVFRVVAGGMRSNVEGLHMIAVDDPTNGFVRVIHSVRLHRSLSVKGLESRVR